MSTSMTLDDLEPQVGGFSDFFCDYKQRHAFQEWIAPKWLEIN